MSFHFATSASEESEAGARADCFWQSVLRFPSKRPQKGVQCVRDVTGEEVWAGSDADFHRAVAVSPGAFTWKRQQRNLVELPALWFRLPLFGRDGAELWPLVQAVLEQHRTPLPHFVVDGDGALTLLWTIEPLRRPKESAPEFHHRCFQQQLQYWRWAVIKLSFALEDLGARALDMATADELLVSLVPLPMPASSELRRHAKALGIEAPRVLHVAGDLAPLRIGAVSKPLKAFNARLFIAIGRTLPKQKKVWRATEVSLEARKPKAAGERHPAAVKLVCANRWDGLSPEESLQDLQAWAATGDRTAFPDRELADLVAWSEKALDVGGPTPSESTKAKRRLRTSRDHVAAAVLGFLADEGGVWAGPVVELSKRAALWAIERGLHQPVPLRTLKRALVDLIELAELTQRVDRCGSTWRSQWALRVPVEAAARPRLLLMSPGDRGAVEAGQSLGHQEESMWAPGPEPASVQLALGEGEGGDVPPQGGPGGRIPKNPIPSMSKTTPPKPPCSLRGRLRRRQKPASKIPISQNQNQNPTRNRARAGDLGSVGFHFRGGASERRSRAKDCRRSMPRHGVRLRTLVGI